MFLGSNFVGGKVTGYLRIVECGGKSESGQNKGEEREREENGFLRSHSLPTPPLAVFPARISLHRPTIWMPGTGWHFCSVICYQLFSLQGNRWMNTIPLSSNLSSRRSATGNSGGKEATGNQHVLKDYLKRRNLILALIRQEIDRLSTWHNPLARPELSFTGLESMVNWANQTVFTERIWRDLVRLAWHMSPDIAVFLPVRYCDSHEWPTSIFS